MSIWNNIYEIHKDIVSRDIVGESIKVPKIGSFGGMPQIYALNGIGEYIWQEIDGKTTLQQILNSILEKFDVSKEQAETDLLTFIEELSNNKLITICT